jgi:hypothetical protein
MDKAVKCRLRVLIVPEVLPVRVGFPLKRTFAFRYHDCNAVDFPELFLSLGKRHFVSDPRGPVGRRRAYVNEYMAGIDEFDQTGIEGLAR